MARCTRKGCGAEYDPDSNTSTSCSYHSGAPVFHEGLKSWSCCSGVNKPVLEFDEFMKIPGCTEGSHTDEKPQVEPPKASGSSSTANLKVTGGEDGKETYSSTASASAASSMQTLPQKAVPPPEPAKEEQDDLAVPVAPGTKCRRKGCDVAFVSDDENRLGEGDGTVCTYHPAPPIFREGSKGYMCCKRRVLEFEEFLKIKGCKKGRHLFSPSKASLEQAEEFTTCRIDHYQTLTEVHVSVFAKQIDQQRSSVGIEEEQIHVDLYLPASKRFKRTINLFGPVDPAASSFKYMSTKLDVSLKKADTRSWTVLEKTDRNFGGANFTFGVGGRTGTIGGKEVVLDEANASKTISNSK